MRLRHNSATAHMCASGLTLSPAVLILSTSAPILSAKADKSAVARFRSEG
jgi:hypothetical protein